MRIADKFLILLALIGVADGVYLTVTHYLNVPVACPETGIINCQKVLSSQYSTIFGVPLGVFGTVFFAVEIVLLLYFKQKDLRVLYNGIGIGFVLYLLYIEYVLGAICIFCTLTHILVILLFAFSVMNLLNKE